MTKTETTAFYMALPSLLVTVTTGTTAVSLPSTVNCAMGG